jgi:DNA polymerase sigma
LNKPYSGGLNSYSIVLMTSTFLNCTPSLNVAQSLFNFLKFYGNFDPKQLGMDGVSYFKIENSQECIQVLDIQNRSNNTAKSAFRIQEI